MREAHRPTLAAVSPAPVIETAAERATRLQAEAREASLEAVRGMLATMEALEQSARQVAALEGAPAGIRNEAEKLADLLNCRGRTITDLERSARR